METHVDWNDLPAGVREAVEDRAGEVVSAETVAHGITCRTALILTTKRNVFFVKGVPTTEFKPLDAQITELALNSAVRGVSPAVRWEAIADEWHLIAFDYVDGRHADLSPGSADLRTVAHLLKRAQACRPPQAYRVPALAERYRPVLRPGDAEALAGMALLHTDTNPHNLLIADRCGYLIDWAMPALGPSWVDPAQTAVRLMEADCPPGDARAWLAGFPDWERAPREARERFVDVVCRDWTARVGEKLAEPSNARFRSLLPPPDA
ncbi:aminoglycoside phosphotransferase [Streptacidiphilus sp. 4-A2]|nr:aminoglycoside phosphotransferase [Streptacidiphilus sp. 4-A2]